MMRVRGANLACAAAALLATLASCGGSDLSVGAQDIHFALRFGQQPSLAQGDSSTTAVAVIDEDITPPRPGDEAEFTSPVELRLVGPMPPGVSGDFAPNPVAPGAPGNLVLRAAVDAQAGRHQLLVEGRIAGGSTTRFFPLSVEVEGNCAAGTEPIAAVYPSDEGILGSRTVALTISGAAYFWGFNSTGDESSAVVPGAIEFHTAQRVEGLPEAVSAASSIFGDTAFVLAGDGALRVLKSYIRSDLGAPGGRAGWMIHALPQSQGFVQVVGGASTTFYARHQDGSVWELGSFGTSTSPQFALVQVPGLSEISSIAMGTIIPHLLALRRDGTVWALGRNHVGQLGDGTTTDAETPIQVPGLTGIQQIAAGGYHSLALRSNGTVLAWGAGSDGQLGHGVAAHSSVPVEVVSAGNNPISGIVSLAAGGAHSLALQANGQVWSWGRGEEGQLGTGSTAPSLTAARFEDFAADSIAAGGNASFILTSGPTRVRAWGSNRSGRLGDGSSRDRHLPDRVLGLGVGEGIDCRQVASDTSFFLSVRRSGSAPGIITGPGIDCGDICSATYPAGTQVQLTAIPIGDSIFSEWIGCRGFDVNPNDCVVTMDRDREVTAAFARLSEPPPPEHMLTIQPAGTGSGTVSGPGISCPEDCSESYPDRTSVTLEATPNEGSSFQGWASGCSQTNGRQCVITMRAARTVSPVFQSIAVQTVVLEVTKNGDGEGTVSGNGINCGDDCEHSFPAGTVVTLTATPEQGSTFVGWAGCNAIFECTITMNESHNVAATFALSEGFSELTLVRSGPGAAFARVLSNPPGIDCGETCRVRILNGTEVILTPAATSPAVQSWTGCDPGAGNQCRVLVDAPHTVTVEFIAPVFHTLTVGKTGAGSGTVTSIPEGIDCGPDCEAAFPDERTITLTATPAAGSQFGDWEGCDRVSDRVICEVDLQSARSVLVRFAL